MASLTIPIELQLTPRSQAVMDALYKSLGKEFSEPPAQPVTAVLPAIGQPWPGIAGIHAGIARGFDGEPDGHLVLLDAVPEEDLSWADAVKWAEGLGDGARLPTRFESALLYANLRDKLDTERWHWTGTQYSSRDAWDQNFSNGYQDSGHKGVEARARAVRRFSI